MILIMDNYDSFTYNLYQLVGQLNDDIIVRRNDEISLEEIRELNPDRIIISPGPGNPTNTRDFGICNQIIHELGNDIPILGVCLGHQGIFAAFGGEIIHTDPVHGKTCPIFHDDDEIFQGITNPLSATRYHSLLCKKETTPDCMKIIAQTKDGMIMGIKHNYKPIYGLQFHPESIGTNEGLTLLKNFMENDYR
ncbi:MAG: aminodeoxychorismate/anthranilate synthase component II [Methanobacterium sp.]|nr:aminodeoxychorismate/anthranilate synthase component II [Methanobacterium sp.]